MAKTDTYHHSGILVACILLWALTGCTHLYEQPIHDISLNPTTNKVGLHVKLILTEEFRNAKWQRESMGDTWIIPIGGNLVHHSVQLMKNVFTHPMFPDDPMEGKNPAAEYFMTPKLVQFDRALGVSAFSENKTSISVEWNLSNPAKETVWVETVQGIGLGTAGNLFTHEEHKRKNLKMALQELFEKTQKILLSSEFLRKLQFAQIK